MVNCTNYIFVVVFAGQFAGLNVLFVSNNGLELIEDVSQCYRFLRYPFFRINCKRQCPKTFPEGRCLQREGKWQCLCGTGNNINMLLTPKEAGQVSKGCNDKLQKHKGCHKLCSKQSFHGHCGQIQGVWQCICVHDKNAVDEYTWKEAKFMHGVCNSNVKDDSGCRAMCPPNFQFGKCVEVNKIWRCRCSQKYFENELYEVRDADRIYKACLEQGSEGSCSDLCPNELKGYCIEMQRRIKSCGCKGSPEDTTWYTVRKAKEMNDVCNLENYQSEEARKSCNELCSLLPGGPTEGECFSRLTYCECICKWNDDDHITLRTAIMSTLPDRKRTISI